MSTHDCSTPDESASAVTMRERPTGRRVSANETQFPEDLDIIHRRLHRRVNLKMDLALLPLLSLLYLFNGLDRGNVGNAETQGTNSLSDCINLISSSPRD